MTCGESATHAPCIPDDICLLTVPSWLGRVQNLPYLAPWNHADGLALEVKQIKHNVYHACVCTCVHVCANTSCACACWCVCGHVGVMPTKAMTPPVLWCVLRLLLVVLSVVVGTARMIVSANSAECANSNICMPKTRCVFSLLCMRPPGEGRLGEQVGGVRSWYSSPGPGLLRACPAARASTSRP